MKIKKRRVSVSGFITLMKKKPTLYIVIISVWICFVGLLCFYLTRIILNLNEDSLAKRIAIITLLSLNTIVLALLWFGSVKDLCFSIAYAITQKKLKKEYEKIEKYSFVPSPAPRFLLLYCTCNDFNPKALSESRKQEYSNFKTVILDDSSDRKYIEAIDKYVIDNDGIELIRRTDKSGYKAGNLNNYLKSRTDYDYFVVLDSDEVIPPDYIIKVLKYFNYNKKCGAVQAKHKASEGENVFQRLMGLCVGSNGTTVQTIKNFYGANALIGHGMTISKECYIATKGFPLVVAEDISFAVEIKNAGMDIIYAPDILCFEEFPVNYVSLKKRQCKWTQGNLEYMKKYDKDINTCDMTWFEKLDIKLSHYSLPIVPLLSFLLAVFTITLGFLGYPIIGYSLVIYAIMIVLLCSPLIPDLFVYHNSKNIFLLLPYFLLNIVTYSSLAPMMLKTVFLGMCGKKAKFIVTPKTSEKFSFKEAIRYSWDSILFSLIIGILSIASCGSILPVIYIVLGCALAPVAIALSNISLQKKFKADRLFRRSLERA